MDIKKLLETNLEPQVGETRLVDGELSMCVATWASYGGGSGPLWAIENQTCQFTTVRDDRYYEGICKKVNPKNHSITIHIIKGNTWGYLVEGTNVVLHASQVRRLHGTKHNGMELIEETDKIVKQVELENRFNEISLEELRHDIPNSHIKGFNKLIGVENYKELEDLIYSYHKVTKEVGKSDSLIMFYKHQPIRDAGDQFRKKLKNFIESYNRGYE